MYKELIFLHKWLLESFEKALFFPHWKPIENYVENDSPLSFHLSVSYNALTMCFIYPMMKTDEKKCYIASVLYWFSRPWFLLILSNLRLLYLVAFYSWMLFDPSHLYVVFVYAERFLVVLRKHWKLRNLSHLFSMYSIYCCAVYTFYIYVRKGLQRGALEPPF